MGQDRIARANVIKATGSDHRGAGAKLEGQAELHDTDLSKFRQETPSLNAYRDKRLPEKIKAKLLENANGLPQRSPSCPEENMDCDARTAFLALCKITDEARLKRGESGIATEGIDQCATTFRNATGLHDPDAYNNPEDPAELTDPGKVTPTLVKQMECNVTTAATNCGATLEPLTDQDLESADTAYTNELRRKAVRHLKAHPNPDGTKFSREDVVAVMLGIEQGDIAPEE